MTSKNASTRRAFLRTAPLLAVPLTAGAAEAGEPHLADELKTRLARHEDEAAIRDLHQAWMREVNRGTPATDCESIRKIAADFEGAPDAIHFASDSQRASGRFACAVEIQTPLALEGTFAQMARLQGNNPVGRTERRVVAADYVKTGGTWAIATVELVQA